MKNLTRTVVLGCGLVILTGCGGDEIVSPGTGGDIIVNNPAPPPPPPPPPPPTGPGLVTPAAGCPTINSTGGLNDAGTISGPTGEYRVCELPAVIDASDNLPYIAGVLYSLPGRVDVGTDQGPTSTGNNVTLGIADGVTVYGGTGRSYLVVNRGNRINAVGTPTRPIVFTSRDNVLGLSTDTSIGQWGGVVLLGRAPVSDCRLGGYNRGGVNSDTGAPFVQSGCEQELEGTASLTLFGGADPADNSGTMQYFQIRYSGFSLAPGNELQSLTTGGTGSGTTLSHFMSFNSSDDAMEFFGGSVNMKYIAAVGADDDTLDVDSGAQANLQYVIAAQRTGGGDSLIELDSPAGDYANDASPRTVLNVANFHFIERSTANSTVVRARGGAKLRLVNGLIDTDTETCVRIDEVATLAADPEFNSILAECDPARPFQGSDGVTDAQVQARWDAGANNDEAAALTLTGMSLFFANTVPAFDAKTIAAYFDTTSYIGAVADANDTWFRNWTCNSATVNFGSSSGNCTSLPVY